MSTTRKSLWHNALLMSTPDSGSSVRPPGGNFTPVEVPCVVSDNARRCERVFVYATVVDSLHRWPTPLDYLVVVALLLVSVALIAAAALENDLGYLGWLSAVGLVGFVWFGTVGNPKRTAL